MKFPELDCPSPNHARAPGHEQLGVCFHHSGLATAEALARLTDPASQVSYHVLIAPDGTRYRLVDETRIAWHAGVSSWRGRSGCNCFLLGVAFAGDTYVAPLTDAQQASALEWLAARWRRRAWTIDWMTDHRQVAPGRKDDLNPTAWDHWRAVMVAAFP